MSDATKKRPEDEEIKRRVLEVLDLSEALSSQARLPVQRDTRAALLKYAGTISREDLDLISEAIEEGCEKVDEEGW